MCSECVKNQFLLQMHQILLSLVVIICIAILSVFIDRIDVKKKKKERLFYMYYLLQATMSIYHVIETLDYLLTRIHFCLYRHKNSPSCCWSWCI